MNTLRSYWLCLPCAVIWLSSPWGVCDGQERPAVPPNFVVIVTDNQRFDTIAALGNPLIKTPNLDRLVRGGTTFTRAVAYPLCTPSRTEMLTGCSALRTGVLGFSQRPPKELAFWPAVMRERGYQTWHIGKWHIVGTPERVRIHRHRGDGPIRRTQDSAAVRTAWPRDYRLSQFGVFVQSPGREALATASRSRPTLIVTLRIPRSKSSSESHRSHSFCTSISRRDTIPI